MKFKVDENLPIEVCHLLQEAGYDCKSVYDRQMSGFADDTLLAVCQSEN